MPDEADNCTLLANSPQRDTDADGFGNACEADLNNDNTVNFADLGLFRLAFFGMPGADNRNPNADFNGDDTTSFLDHGIMRSMFFASPGPAGLIN